MMIRHLPAGMLEDGMLLFFAGARLEVHPLGLRTPEETEIEVAYVNEHTTQRFNVLLPVSRVMEVHIPLM